MAISREHKIAQQQKRSESLLINQKNQSKMSKVFVAFFSAVIFSVSSVAYAQGFSMNISAAPQFSFVRNIDDSDPTLDKQATFKPRVGIGIAYQFAQGTGLELDVLYSWQGQKYRTNGVERNQKINYVKVPVLFSYVAAPKSKVSFVGKIGPQLSFLTTSKLTDGNDNDVISDTDDRFEDVGFGGVVVAGAQIRLSSRLVLEPSVWFDNEFTNAESENFRTLPVRRESRHNMTTGLQLQLIYKFDKK
ncbi:outer membrane beta-barrel protein [Lacibacter sediminis]|uniref:Outer membrane beta-barrel protein n=1 Tax=Lacibacter sediminis TaxID=2760713 RepID=A0A7G5XK58_9BACT|nr:outer membrane beta-barrel protein [Lacibacter sediminis]QNA45861.1 outer membrane beta-barrel protein [Lacibacter sediminis]